MTREKPFNMRVVVSILLLLFLISFSSLTAQEINHTIKWNIPTTEEVVTASEFLDRTDSVDYEKRQKVARDLILRGNVPDFLKELASIQFINDELDTLTIWVTKDYLSIGVDWDFIRIPLSFPSAQLIANNFNMYIPTSVMVDSIYAQAAIKVAPIPLSPGEEMRSNAYYKRHQSLIEAQVKEQTERTLMAGHKKDIVITKRLNEQPGRIAIYGWHRSKNDPIQPVSLVHGKHYEDYSHGVRLVHPMASLNGHPMRLKELVNDPRWKSHLTNEGEINIEKLSHGK